jgi:hypothetical protein
MPIKAFGSGGTGKSLDEATLTPALKKLLIGYSRSALVCPRKGTWRL